MTHKAVSDYRITAANNTLERLKSTLYADKGKRDLLLEQRAGYQLERDNAVKQVSVFDKVQILLQKTSDYARRQVKERIENVVSEALNVVFGGNHKFVIELAIRAGQPVAVYYLDDGAVFTQLEKPDYDRGGGKIDVISLALRLAIAEMEGIQGPLLLDEIGKHISKEYAVNVAFFLKQYSAEFNRQIILITHNADLAEIGETSISVSRKQNGESVVKVE